MESNTEIVVRKYANLAQETKNKLNDYIAAEFGHIPFVAETEWASPDWTIISYVNGEIAAFYNIVERSVFVDSVERKVGGVNNVISLQEYRGQGIMSKMLQGLGDLIFENLGCEMGLLLCADDLIAYYEKFAWYSTSCPVYFEQSSGKKLWGARTMLLSRQTRFEPNLIDLNGLPW